MREIDVDEILALVDCACNLDCGHTEAKEYLEAFFENWLLISKEEYKKLKEE